MYPLQIFLQRRRKLLVRIGALLILGLGGMIAVLPRADAHPTIAVVDTGSLSFLLDAQPLSSRHFAALTPPSHP